MTRSPVLILAAGGSRRMGRPKQTLPFQGSSLLRHAAQRALQTRANEVIVVTGGAHGESLAELAGLPVRTVHNPQWLTGMGSSVRAGLNAIPHLSESLLIMTCDQPLVQSSSLEGIMLALESHPRIDAVAASYANVLGVPAAFRNTLFEALAKVSADEGARHILKRHSARVMPFPLAEAEFDVDTPEQYCAVTLRGKAS